MSLDLWLKKPECPTCHHSDETESKNYTYNVCNMWYEVFPEDDGMVMIDGMTGKHSLTILTYFLGILLKNPDRFKVLNPKNGWGCYDTFVKFIKELIELANKHPDWIWEASR